MGSGIAQVAGLAEWEVTLIDSDPAALDRASASIGDSLDRFVAKGKIGEADARGAQERITATTDLGEAARAEIVVEAVFERLQVKQDVFAELSRICGPDTVLATNTSAIPITEIASAASHPERVVGTHFFSPVPMMRLCELVRGLHTSDEALSKARAFAESAGKTCVVVNRDVAGFATTRLICAFVNEAVSLVEDGVISAEDLDTACRLGFGHPMGPLATADLTGIDVITHATENIYEDTADAKFFPPSLLRRMVASGRIGRKSGEGFFDYELSTGPKRYPQAGKLVLRHESGIGDDRAKTRNQASFPWAGQVVQVGFRRHRRTRPRAGRPRARRLPRDPREQRRPGALRTRRASAREI
ncbi:3-hydroxyacyl-CoA dehydrogenase family protein [Glycomyces halotolerans]